MTLDRFLVTTDGAYWLSIQSKVLVGTSSVTVRLMSNAVMVVINLPTVFIDLVMRNGIDSIACPTV